MELLDQHSLTLIPQRVRIAVMVALVAATLVFASVAVWLVVKGSESTLVSTVLSLFKAVAIATVLWFFFMLGQKAQSRDDLLKLTGHILKSEIPQSIAAYASIDFIVKSGDGKGLGEHRRVDPSAMDQHYSLVDNYVPGTTRVDFTIARWPYPGLERLDLLLHVHLNVRKVDIVYKFPLAHGQGVKLAQQIRTGAEESDWTIDELEEMSSVAGSRRVEIRGRLKLTPDFLHNSTERLFVANDIAAMTQFLVHKLVASDQAGNPLPG